MAANSCQLTRTTMQLLCVAEVHVVVVVHDALLLLYTRQSNHWAIHARVCLAALPKFATGIATNIPHQKYIQGLLLPFKEVCRIMKKRIN